MSETFDQGLATRREVLGDEHVSRSMAAHPLARPLQELLTEYAWGAVWSRPSLPRQTRSLVTVALLTAGRHHEELRVHVRGALRNGCTPEQIAEVAMQSAIYAGVPTALEAMRVVTTTIDAATGNASDPDR
jgi:4-carboxymuconolactone decarboxylase